VRSPRLADRLELVGRRPELEPLRAARALLQRDVARGPRVGASQRGEEVDLGRPGTDPGQRDERGADAGVVQRRDRVEVECPVLEGGRERAHVAVLLAAEPVRAELLVRRVQHALRREPAEPRDEPVVGGARGGERDLLLEDQEDERREARLARPELRDAVLRDDRGEIGIRIAELGDRRRERAFVEHALHASRAARYGLG
jgi:hypothetical protein